MCIYYKTRLKYQECYLFGDQTIVLTFFYSFLLTLTICQESQEFLVTQDVDSHCAQTSPTSSESDAQEYRRTWGPALSGICQDTRTVPQFPRPWLFSQAGRSCRAHGRKALF